MSNQYCRLHPDEHNDYAVCIKKDCTQRSNRLMCMECQYDHHQGHQFILKHLFLKKNNNLIKSLFNSNKTDNKCTHTYQTSKSQAQVQIQIQQDQCHFYVQDINEFINRVIDIQQSNVNSKLQQYKSIISANIGQYEQQIQSKNKQMDVGQSQPDLDSLVADLEYIYQISDTNRQNQKLSQFVNDLHGLKDGNPSQINDNRVNLNQIEQDCQNFKNNVNKMIDDHFRNIEIAINQQIKHAKYFFDSNGNSNNLNNNNIDDYDNDNLMVKRRVDRNEQRLELENQKLKQLNDKLEVEIQNYSYKLNQSQIQIQKLENDNMDIYQSRVQFNNESSISDIYIECQEQLKNNKQKYEKQIRDLKDQLYASRNKLRSQKSQKHRKQSQQSNSEIIDNCSKLDMPQENKDSDGLPRITIKQDDQIRTIMNEIQLNNKECQIEVVNIRDIMYLMKINTHLQKEYNKNITKMIEKVSLLMNNSNIDPELFGSTVVPVLNKTPNLVKLELQFCNNQLDDQCLVEIDHSIQKMPNIEQMYLRLDGNQISDKNVIKNLLKTILCLQNIEFLYLDVCEILINSVNGKEKIDSVLKMCLHKKL